MHLAATAAVVWARMALPSRLTCTPSPALLPSAAARRPLCRHPLYAAALSTLSARAAHHVVPDASPVLPCLSPLTAAWAMNRPPPTLSCSAPPHLLSLGYPPAKRGTKISSLWQMLVLERTSSSLPREQDPQRWWPLPHPRSVPIMLFSVFSPKKKKTLAYIFPFPKNSGILPVFDSNPTTT
jgi:hypothetical protein